MKYFTFPKIFSFENQKEKLRTNMSFFKKHKSGYLKYFATKQEKLSTRRGTDADDQDVLLSSSILFGICDQTLQKKSAPCELKYLI